MPKAGNARVLCLLPGVPVPANTGGALRALSMVKALDQAFELTAMGWGRPGEDGEGLARMLRGEAIILPRKPRVDGAFAEAEGMVLGVPLGYARYGWFPPLLRRLLETQRFDAIHFDHPHTALAWRSIRRLQPHAKLVLDAHNVEAEIASRLAHSAPKWQRPLLRWHAQRVAELEAEVARNADLVFTCSGKDQAAFEKMGARRVRVIPNSIPPVELQADEVRRDVVFVGSLDWRPNAEAALLLARHIWPRVRRLLPGVRLVIVGRNPPQAVAELACEDIVVAGSVPSVAPYLASAFATAVPLRAGSGTRIKILEAWSGGVPVVATRIAAEGLPYGDGEDLILAETNGEFVRALARLWNEPALAARLVRNGHRTVLPFTPAKVAEAVARAYREELGVGSASPESAPEYSAA